ncbi:MAG: hypothetical protein LJF04_04420 [Gemmatimonadetes bacterium]|nr:hypothetical protein [Gemmatimonadota bacterium]
MSTVHERRRSVAFLEHEGEPWSCFLVTYSAARDAWHGYFSFRPGNGETAEDEVRTTDIFIEASEAEIHDKARGLGRPLLGGLLASAIHTSRAGQARSSKLRLRFRELLAENAREISGDWSEEGHELPSAEDLDGLHSLYASYRLDQVCHFIGLVDPQDFETAVDRILEGESVDFRASDRIQFAMMVVEHIERHLPLPPFEVWAKDYLCSPDAYRLYTHTLHREGRLP